MSSPATSQGAAGGSAWVRVITLTLTLTSNPSPTLTPTLNPTLTPTLTPTPTPNFDSNLGRRQQAAQQPEEVAQPEQAAVVCSTLQPAPSSPLDRRLQRACVCSLQRVCVGEVD